MSEHNNMHDLDETADKTVAAINKVDTKVTEMRQRRMADPDTLGDKALKMIIPSLAGLVGGKLSSKWCGTVSWHVCIPVRTTM